MAEGLILKLLEFPCHIGVTDAERRAPQPIGVDLEMDYTEGAFAAAASTDDIAKATDYAKIAERVTQVGTGAQFHLLETLADRISERIFAEFPIAGLRVWVRKLNSPIQNVQGSVGVRLERRRVSAGSAPQPASFLVEQWHRLPKGLVLDVASGRGRNALFLARRQFSVEAMDRDEEALEALAAAALQHDLSDVSVAKVDFEADAAGPPDLPIARYDVILVFFYLYRPLFPALRQALKSGGMLVYETFLIDNHLQRQHPRRREFCLEHNELLRLTSGLRLLYYDEGEHDSSHGSEPAMTARLLAQKEP